MYGELDENRSAAKERDKYLSMMAYFAIYGPEKGKVNNHKKVTKEEAGRLFRQIQGFTNPKYREKLFCELEAYIGNVFDDEKQKWEASRLK